MKEILNKFRNNLKRVFSNDSVSYRIYLIWGGATLLLFVFFGLVPVSKSLISNIKLSNEMVETNSNLSKKIQELKKIKEDLEIVDNSVDLLDANLPDVYDPHNHLVELTLIASGAGYQLDRFSLGSAGILEGVGYRDVNLTMTENGDINKLITGIESSARLSEITNVKVSKNLETTSINMTVRSFTMEKQ